MSRRIRIALLTLIMAITAVFGGLSIQADNDSGALVGTVTGTGVRLRKSPSLSAGVLTALNKGQQVLVSGETNGWYHVSYAGYNGYMSADYVSVEKTEDTVLGKVTGSAVNVRSEPNTSSSIKACLLRGTTVELAGETGGWYAVQFNNVKGYMHGDYVEPIDPNSAEMQARNGLIAAAKQYLGVKYVYGGSTPASGFDCSGFITYVFKHYNGYTFKVRSQLYLNGKRVDRYEDLLPGDLVFFGTHENGGITHVGIFVGDGKFIHAPYTGTVISITDMSPGSRYYERFVTGRSVF